MNTVTGIRIQRAWPQLGRALYQLEHDAFDSRSDLSQEQKSEQRKLAKEAVLAQCDSHEEEYEAFEVVRLGRASAIVGNPRFMGKTGEEYDLPYTGLEGYYAGSEQSPQRPGMRPEQIIEEEAAIGLDLLAEIKKRCIETYSWAHFARMRHALDQATTEAEVEDLRTIGTAWTIVVRRLRERIYQNPEYPQTPLEEVRALLDNNPALVNDKQLKAAYPEIMQRSAPNEHAPQPDHEKSARFAGRLTEYHQFRDETYELLRSVPSTMRQVSYLVDDADFAHAAIKEQRVLPLLADRNSAPSYLVHLATEQREGYLFLSKLGEIGGNPLVRCVLTQEE